MRLKRYERDKIGRTLYVWVTHKEKMKNIKYTWKDDSRVNIQTSKSFLK